MQLAAHLPPLRNQVEAQEVTAVIGYVVMATAATTLIVASNIAVAMMRHLRVANLKINASSNTAVMVRDVLIPTAPIATRTAALLSPL